MKIKNTLLLFMTAMIWGFAFIAQRVGVESIGNYTFNAIRFALGAVSLIPVILFLEHRETNGEHRQKMKKTMKVSVLAGVVLFTASTLQLYGIAITQSAGKSGFITSLYMVLVPVIGILMKKKTNINTWLGVAFGIAGMFLLSISDDWKIGLGDVLLLIGAVFWALHIIVIDENSHDIYVLRFSSVQFAVVSILAGVFALIFEDVGMGAIRMSVIPILYTGICSTAIAYTCQAIGQKNADPTYAAIILSTESVFGAIGGVLFLNESMPLRGYLGCAMIFAGIIISQLKPARLTKKSISTKDIHANDYR